MVIGDEKMNTSLVIQPDIINEIEPILIKNIKVLYDLLEVLYSIDLIDEADSTIKLFICSIIDNLDEAYKLIIQNNNSGVCNYFRTVLEKVVYCECISREKDMVLVIKNRDYNELKKIRNDYKIKGIVIKERDIHNEIDIYIRRNIYFEKFRDNQTL